MCRGQAVIVDYLNIIKVLKKIQTTVPERRDKILNETGYDRTGSRCTPAARPNMKLFANLIKIDYNQ